MRNTRRAPLARAEAGSPAPGGNPIAGRPHEPETAEGRGRAARGPTVAFRNPVCAEDCPDPAVLRVRGVYYAFSTSGHAANAFPIRCSHDLASWKPAGWIFPEGRRPRWAVGDFWAPEVTRIGRRYHVYYTARDAGGRLCIGVARAFSPLGPWEDLGRPLIRDDRVGMIDSHCFVDRDGRRYLFWKQDGNDLRPKERTPIYVQELSHDGLALLGRPRVVLINDQPWEGDLVEGPWLVRRGTFYYLFYSGNNFWEPDYAVGVARARSVHGPYVKMPETLLRRDEHWLGPGHGCVVRAHDGRDYFVYHAWQRGRVGSGHPRLMLIDRIHWEDGWPRINDGSPSNVAQPVVAERPTPRRRSAAVRRDR